MLCILAFIIFLLLYPILGIFSKDYRQLFHRSFECVFKKVTFKPCDIDLGEEIKGKILGKIIFKYPKLAKLLNKTFDWLALGFVILSLWSLIYMVVAGVNLIVYDTCNPNNVESCALGGASCGVDQAKLTFADALEERRLREYITTPFTDFGEAVSLLPDRFRKWEAKDYLPDNPSYYSFDSDNPTAVEAVDPGCISCANLYANQKKSNFNDNYNLAYLLYPIPDENSESGTRFYNSMIIASYVEASKDFELENRAENESSGDWQLLGKIWENADDADSLQEEFNFGLSQDEARQKLQDLLLEIGYTSEQVSQIADKAETDEIKDRLKNQAKIVEDEIRTIKIPTIIFGGRRYNRVLEVDDLNK